MKLFVYGEFGPMALEKSLVRHWKDAPGVQELILLERLPLPDRLSIDRIIRRFAPAQSSRIRAHNDEVLRLFRSRSGGHAALLVFKGMELLPETLRSMKTMGVHLFCYNPDHPFVYSGRGSGSEFMKGSIDLYDGYFTYHREAQTMLEECGVPSALVPFGYEDDAMTEPFVYENQEVLRGCFIGNPNPLRVRFLKQLEGRIPIDLFGNNWAQHFGKSPNIQVHGAVHDNAHWKTMAKYRFQLNMMAEHNPNAHNMRTFSAPAAGAILVAPRSSDHVRFFEDGKEALLYDSVDDCIQRCDALLRMTFQMALEIRIAARKRSLDSGYSYTERARVMLEYMLKSTN
jgi:hypothetical protein